MRDGCGLPRLGNIARRSIGQNIVKCPMAKKLWDGNPTEGLLIWDPYISSWGNLGSFERRSWLRDRWLNSHDY